LGSTAGIRSVKFVIALLVFSGFVWVTFFPHPYYWAIGFNALLLPLILLHAFFGNTPFIFSNQSNPGGEEIDLMFVFVAICLGLVLRTFADYQEVSDPSALGLFAAFFFWNRANFLVFFTGCRDFFDCRYLSVLFFSIGDANK
jgi:hypothetical protein